MYLGAKPKQPPCALKKKQNSAVQQLLCGRPARRRRCVRHHCAPSDGQLALVQPKGERVDVAERPPDEKVGWARGQPLVSMAAPPLVRPPRRAIDHGEPNTHTYTQHPEWEPQWGRPPQIWSVASLLHSIRVGFARAPLLKIYQRYRSGTTTTTTTLAALLVSLMAIVHIGLSFTN